ncbi:MAG: YqaE/Pmp3 family membrane protein [Pseudomonadota bacterium]
MSTNTPTASSSGSDLFMIILAVLLPPIAVFFRSGFNGTLALNILLTILGYVPGLVHAVWVVAKS